LRIWLRQVNQAPELRLFPRGFEEASVLSLQGLCLAFGRALKTTNPAALAPFAAGTTGAGLDGAVFIANWLDLRHRVFLTHGLAARRVIRAWNSMLAALCASCRTSSLPVHPGGRLPRKIEGLAGERRGTWARGPVRPVCRQQECYTL